MKIITVGNGFIANHLPYPIMGDRIQANEKQIRSFLELHKPDVVVNCIAFCGIKNIDDCETQRERTLTANLIIPSLLARECYNLGIHFIQMSSGCIYYGKSPNYKLHRENRDNHYLEETVTQVDTGWKETDHANPLSFYSKTKYACDLTVGELPNVTSLRLRMPVSWKNHPRNILNKLISYKDIVETLNSITFVDDLVRVIDWAITKQKMGIYHIANPQPATHSQLLEEYKKYNPKHEYKSISVKELDKHIIAPRSNCILDCSKLTSEGFVMTPTKEALKHCMKKYMDQPEAL